MFTDQEFDVETGLYNYNARLYDPVIGRFISPDSIVQAPFDPQTLNRYSYVRNNPLIYTDPSGHFFLGGLDILIGAAIGATVAAIQGENIGEGALKGAISATIFAFAGFTIDHYQITDPLLEGVIKGGAIAASNAANDEIDNGILNENSSVSNDLNDNFWIAGQFASSSMGTNPQLIPNPVHPTELGAPGDSDPPSGIVPFLGNTYGELVAYTLNNFGTSVAGKLTQDYRRLAIWEEFKVPCGAELDYSFCFTITRSRINAKYLIQRDTPFFRAQETLCVSTTITGRQNCNIDSQKNNQLRWKNAK